MEKNLFPNSKNLFPKAVGQGTINFNASTFSRPHSTQTHVYVCWEKYEKHYIVLMKTWWIMLWWFVTTNLLLVKQCYF